MHLRPGAAKVRNSEIFTEDVFANIFILTKKNRNCLFERKVAKEHDGGLEPQRFATKRSSLKT